MPKPKTKKAKRKAAAKKAVQTMLENAVTGEVEDFLNHVWQLIEYWRETKPSRHECCNGQEDDIQAKMEGLAFSILVALDGGSGVGPYHVVPLKKSMKYDIGGGLHELFHEAGRKYYRAKKATALAVPTLGLTLAANQKGTE